MVRWTAKRTKRQRRVNVVDRHLESRKLSVFPSVCPSHILRTIHLIYFRLSSCITGSTRTSSVVFGAILTWNMFNIKKKRKKKKNQLNCTLQEQGSRAQHHSLIEAHTKRREDKQSKKWERQRRVILHGMV